jgi:hypothetical protein
MIHCWLREYLQVRLVLAPRSGPTTWWSATGERSDEQLLRRASPFPDRPRVRSLCSQITSRRCCKDKALAPYRSPA